MNPLSFLFKKNKLSLQKEDGVPKNSGEVIAEVTGGANLVDGQQTWELAENKKHDIEVMKRCCDAELKTMDKAGLGWFLHLTTLSVSLSFPEKLKITSKKSFTASSILRRLRRSIQKTVLKVSQMLEKVHGIRP